MGYACPVCSTPQADERHLADHVALTAMVHGDDHETWLDETVEGWAGMGPADLGPVIADHAAETDYPRVFEDTTPDAGVGGSTHDHEGGHDDPRLEDHLAAAGRRGPRERSDRGGGRGDLTAEGQAAVARAREMTREMLDGGSEDPDGPDGADPDADDAGGSAGESGSTTGGTDAADRSDATGKPDPKDASDAVDGVTDDGDGADADTDGEGDGNG